MIHPKLKLKLNLYQTDIYVGNSTEPVMKCNVVGDEFLVMDCELDGTPLNDMLLIFYESPKKAVYRKVSCEILHEYEIDVLHKVVFESLANEVNE